MVTLVDVERAIATRDPQLGEILVRYLAQDDPDPGRDELRPTPEDMDEDEVDVVAGAYTIDRLRSEVSERGLANKNPTEKKLARREAFAAAEGSPFSPPRLKLWPKLVELYTQGDPAARAALLHVFANAEMKWGVWKAAKTIYKRAEELHDAALFGVLAYRFDAMTTTPYAKGEIGPGTLLYLRRRAWRYLRLLGQASPDAYPAYVVEVLRHYPASYGSYSPSWIAAHVFGHSNMRGARGSGSFGPPTYGDPMAARAFPSRSASVAAGLIDVSTSRSSQPRRPRVPSCRPARQMPSPPAPSARFRRARTCRIRPAAGRPARPQHCPKPA